MADARPAGLDWYLFGCGLDYETCASDFAKLSGPVALPPLSSLGVWWSRHWGDSFDRNPFGPMSEQAIMDDVVVPYQEKGLPLHVVVMDMEWHTMLNPKDCTTFIGKRGWGGYTWNHTLFPDPAKFLATIHNYMGGTGTKLALNFHPDEGIDPCQEGYDAMARALGVDPKSRVDLPDLNPTALNETYVDAYFEHMIEPTLVDFPWTDSPQVTTWTNYLYVRYAAKKGKRVVNFSRYGGVGQQRTPTGFSGELVNVVRNVETSHRVDR